MPPLKKCIMKCENTPAAVSFFLFFFFLPRVLCKHILGIVQTVGIIDGVIHKVHMFSGRSHAPRLKSVL